jgi:hypothetical protein
MKYGIDHRLATVHIPCGIAVKEDAVFFDADAIHSDPSFD